jgi:transcription elongation factor
MNAQYMYQLHLLVDISAERICCVCMMHFTIFRCVRSQGCCHVVVGLSACVNCACFAVGVVVNHNQITCALGGLLHFLLAV